jgi:O-methyltransferase
MVGMDIHGYVGGQRLISDQITKPELEVILAELRRTIVDDVPGDVAEFGCYEGTTSVHLVRFLAATDKRLFLYDSFEGLPDKITKDESPAGMQFKKGELLASKKRLITNLKHTGMTMPHIKKAWFSELAPKDVPEQISLAFLDGDYYDSILDPLRLIWPKLSVGSVVIVDDYANEALPGAAKAVDEWLTRHPAKLSVRSSLAIIHPVFS